MQHHRRGYNNIPSFLQRTAPIAHSLCEGWTPHDLHILVTAPFCCDRTSRAAYEQTFAPWQQVTIEFTCHDHSIIACSRHIYVWCCSSRTSCWWWITQSTQHHWKGCNTSLQRDDCIPNKLVTMSVAKGRASPPWKNFLPFWKMSWTYCMHNHCFRACYRCKIWASLRKLFALPWCPKLVTGLRVKCCLVTTVSFATQLSLFTIAFFRFNIKF